MRVLVTGAEGFLGWHTRVRLHALTGHDVVAVGRGSWAELPRLARGADAVVHVAGVNRGSPEEVERGNIELARDVCAAVTGSGSVSRVVFANSVWSGSDSPYGRGKAAAARLLAQTADSLGVQAVDVRLPNLFGEHGRAGYNSFVATFVDAILTGRSPDVVDRPLHLLHAQDGAQALLDALTTPERQLDPAGTPTTVAEVHDLLSQMARLYTAGDLPALTCPLEVDLFNTLRAAMFPGRYPMSLPVRSDPRGRLVEAVRCHGGQGQTFASTTRQGVTRGEHFHLGKVERFAVLSGQARISLRRVLTDEVVHFDVSGAEPVVVDMPTMWAHNITNTGPGELLTLFWTHTLFDPQAPDTFAEPVEPTAAGTPSPTPTNATTPTPTRTPTPERDT